MLQLAHPECVNSPTNLPMETGKGNVQTSMHASSSDHEIFQPAVSGSCNCGRRFPSCIKSVCSRLILSIFDLFCLCSCLLSLLRLPHFLRLQLRPQRLPQQGL